MFHSWSSAESAVINCSGNGFRKACSTAPVYACIRFESFSPLTKTPHGYLFRRIFFSSLSEGGGGGHKNISVLTTAQMSHERSLRIYDHGVMHVAYSNRYVYLLESWDSLSLSWTRRKLFLNKLISDRFTRRQVSEDESATRSEIYLKLK